MSALGLEGHCTIYFMTVICISCGRPLGGKVLDACGQWEGVKN